MPLKNVRVCPTIANKGAIQQERELCGSNESEEQREQRLERKRTDTAAIRSNESEEHREQRLERKRTDTAAIRSNESEEHREQRLESKRTDTAAIRSNESEEQRERRLETKRIATAASRSKKWDDLTRIAFNYQASTGNHDHPSLRINSMMKACTFCKAKKFQDETLGICCSGGKVLRRPTITTRYTVSS